MRDEGTVRTHAVLQGQITMAAHLWLTWLIIASEHRSTAMQARAEQIKLGVSSVALGDALTAEMHASMIAISGAAHAIDALYGEIRPHVSVPIASEIAWRSNSTARRARIFETLKLGCKLGERTRSWPPRFKSLYDLRDPVVHHETTFRPTAPHPNGLTNVAQEMADYCGENATEALDLALDVALTVIKSPNGPQLRTWAARMADVCGQLEQLQGELPTTRSRPAAR